MTGQLFAAGAASPRLLSATARAALAPEAQLRFRPDAHTHLCFEFEDGGPEVYLRDTRKFGKVLWLADGEAHPRLARLGIDALEVDGALLFAATRGRRVAIKNLLLDQSILAGVGNIYADEALFLAGVRPTRSAARVTRRECDAIASGLQRVLGARSRPAGRASATTSRRTAATASIRASAASTRGAASRAWPAATPIARVVLGARSTHYCPRCQR